MELQQQQQQLISMEGIENSNFRALLTKLINVMLSLLAVILIFVSTVASMLGPFLTTRYSAQPAKCSRGFWDKQQIWQIEISMLTLKKVSH